MQEESVLREGLRTLAQRWEHSGAQLISRRLEGALGREFRFECHGESPLCLRLDRKKATVTPVDPDRHPHATLAMQARDWKQVFSGKWSVMTVVLGGRTNFPKHERRYIMQLSMVMQALLLLEP
jgi:putative sterol carrier protein